jgi:integrase
MLQQGVYPKVVSERLGHSTIGITMDIYTRVLPNMQKDAALKFEKLFN